MSKKGEEGNGRKIRRGVMKSVTSGKRRRKKRREEEEKGKVGEE